MCSINAFGITPVIVEFNYNWARMFHNDEWERFLLTEAVDIFNDIDNIGMQESIKCATVRLNIITSSLGDFDTKVSPLY
jgi:hypothetical protein